MREVGIADASSGLELTFDQITDLASECRYKDCTHVHEQGCEVLAALDTHDIDPESYDNYLKMEKEKSFFESDQIEKKKKDKDFGKLIKQFHKERKRGKY